MKQTIEVQLYNVMARAVEEGVRLGWSRAHKHTDEPDEEQVCEAMETAVMEALSEVVQF